MLLTCSHCEGFVPRNALACPNCGTESLDPETTSKIGSLAKSVMAAAVGGVVAVTLMACYGGPHVPLIDSDGDGYAASMGDCNDQDAATHPGAPDTKGDGVDQNCDGVDGVAAGEGGAGGGGAGGGGATGSATTP